MFEQLSDIYVVSGKHETAVYVEIQLWHSTKELIAGQSNDTFCSTISRLISDMTVPPDRYFIKDDGFLHNIVREDDKLFHALVVPLVLTTKYILHQVHNALGHSGTARPYWCLK